MSKRFINYQDELIKSLSDPKEAESYLNAALEDDDPRIFLLALKNVLEAKKTNLKSIAEKSELSRENLYRILSPKGNPKLNSLKSLLGSVGLQLQVQDLNLTKR